MSTMVIDGKPASARSGATVEIHDPATGELVDRVPQAGVEETRQAIDAAHAARCKRPMDLAQKAQRFVAIQVFQHV